MSTAHSGLTEFRRLVGGLYETLDDASSWPDYLESLGQAVGAQYSIWISMNIEDPCVGAAFGSRERHEEFVDRHLVRGGNALNPSVALAAQGYFQTGGVYDFRYVDRRSSVYSPEYASEVLSHLDLGMGIGITALAEGADYMVFTAYFEDAAHDSTHSRAMLDRLAPHAVRAARQEVRLRGDRSRLEGLVAESAARGACVLGLDASARVTFASPNTGAVMHALVSNLRVRGRRLEILLPEAAGIVSRWLRDFQFGWTVHERLPLRHGDRLDGVLELRALHGGLRTVVPARTVALAVVHSRSLALLAQAEALAARHSLSRIESEVAKAILEGMPVEAIALRRGRSAHTIRHQLEAIKAKVGVATRAELVAAARRTK